MRGGVQNRLLGVRDPPAEAPGRGQRAGKRSSVVNDPRNFETNWGAFFRGQLFQCVNLPAEPTPDDVLIVYPVDCTDGRLLLALIIEALKSLHGIASPALPFVAYEYQNGGPPPVCFREVSILGSRKGPPKRAKTTADAFP